MVQLFLGGDLLKTHARKLQGKQTDLADGTWCGRGPAPAEPNKPEPEDEPEPNPAESTPRNADF